jgi:ferredoxin
MTRSNERDRERQSNERDRDGESDASAGGDANDAAVTVTVVDDDGDVERRLTAPRGATLRDVLLAGGVSPYTRLTSRVNCGGRGVCATCGVRVLAGDAAPGHWHDRLAARFGYPRLSCQLELQSDLAVQVPDKLVWGGRERE